MKRFGEKTHRVILVVILVEKVSLCSEARAAAPTPQPTPFRTKIESRLIDYDVRSGREFPTRIVPRVPRVQVAPKHSRGQSLYHPVHTSSKEKNEPSKGRTY